MKFPTELLVIERAEFCLGGAMDLTIFLRPFELPPSLQHEWAILQETLVSFPDLSLPTSDLLILAGQRLAFPTNPQPGCVGGSIYIDSCYVPVDLKEISFGAWSGAGVAARIRCVLAFPAAGLGDFADTHWEFDVDLS